MKVSVLTLGCKTNQAESSLLESNFRANGWNVVDLKEGPDLCVINTCSVTGKTDYQSRQLIRRASNTGSRVIVTGCFSELNRDLVGSMNGVECIVPNSDKHNIVSKICGSTSCNGLGCGSGRSRFFVKVQEGCNGTCTYCIIPKARGKSRSIEPQAIIDGIQEASNHYNEVVLTAIHLGTYGYDLIPKVTLSYLLKRCLKETSIRRIRLSSLEANEVDRELIEIMAEERVCKHLHIPLQSGSDQVLKAMGRPYNSRFYYDKLLEIHEVMPSACIGTDVIVGFPGETDGDFRNTLDILESLPISYFHVFPFSARPGTVAASMSSRVAMSVIRKRCSMARDLSEVKKAEFRRAQVGKILDVVVEGIEDSGSAIGLSGNYMKVRAVLKGVRPRDIVAVGIAGSTDSYLLGYPI